MNDKVNEKINVSRRGFLYAATAAAALPLMPGLGHSKNKVLPDSKFYGVQIGAITYSFRSMPGSAEDILNYALQCGLSSLELMGDPAEQFAGAPVLERPPWRWGETVSDSQRAEYQKKRAVHAEKLKAFRSSVSMDKFKALKKKYNDAGVNIHIVKFGSIGPNMSEDEVHYCFNAAKALGARGITTEISEEKARYLGPIADEHQLMIGFHNHTQVNSGSYEKPFSYGKYLGMNLDVGHYVAGTNESPIPLIEKYAAEGRVLSIHIKDRKVNNGDNMPFGQGDTPLALILQLMKRNQYTFPADIELEYQIPKGSNAVVEVKNCLDYCKTALADMPESRRRR